MKARIITLLLLTLSVCGSVRADHPKGQHHGQGACQTGSADRIVAQLGLDDATASRFTTVYNQYVAEMHAAYKQHAMIRPQKGADGQPQRLTDEQIKHNLEAQFALSQTTLDLRKKYYKEYLKFLTPRQIEKLGKLEKRQASGVRKTADKHHQGHGKKK